MPDLCLECGHSTTLHSRSGQDCLARVPAPAPPVPDGATVPTSTVSDKATGCTCPGLRL